MVCEIKNGRLKYKLSILFAGEDLMDAIARHESVNLLEKVERFYSIFNKNMV
jgi:hypothetical protein